MSTTRRAFLTGSFALLAAPRGGEAQQRVPKIGFLVPRASVDNDDSLEAFRRGLQELGYVEGKNLIVELRFSREPSQQAALIAELINLKVDVLLTWTTPAALAAARATSTIPVVVMTGDPIRTGLATSLARPGGNVTGIAILVDDLEIKKLQLIKQAVPAASRVAVMWNSNNPVWAPVVERLREKAPTLSVKLEELPVSDAGHLENALRSATSAGAGAVLVVEEALLNAHRQHLADLVVKHRLPAIFNHAEFVRFGGLMSYSVNTADMIGRLAGYADKIIRGAKPADLPIEQPTKFELVVNMKTAKALRLTIPPSLLLRADQVLE